MRINRLERLVVWIVITTFLWSNLVWAGGVKCYKLSVPSQTTAIIPFTRAFTNGQEALKGLVEQGISTKEVFYKRLTEELKRGKPGELAGMPVLMFSDRNNPSVLSYYIFNPKEPYFSRITTEQDVDDSFWQVLQEFGVNLSSEVREFSIDGKKYYQQVFAITDNELGFINTCLKMTYPDWWLNLQKGEGRSIIKGDIDEKWKGVRRDEVLGYDTRKLSRVSESSEYRNWLIEYIEKKFGRSLDVISIGSGRGVLEEALQKGWWRHRVLAVDLKPGYVKECRSKGIEAIEADDINFVHLLEPNRSFDLVVFSESIGSIGLSAIEEASKVLREGGHILITDYPYESDREAEEVRKRFPTNRLKVDEIRFALQKYGYGNIKEYSTQSFTDDDGLYKGPMVVISGIKRAGVPMEIEVIVEDIVKDLFIIIDNIESHIIQYSESVRRYLEKVLDGRLSRYFGIKDEKERQLDAAGYVAGYIPSGYTGWRSRLFGVINGVFSDRDSGVVELGAVEDVKMVGNKGRSFCVFRKLGLMYPRGVVVTTAAVRRIIDGDEKFLNQVGDKIVEMVNIWEGQGSVSIGDKGEIEEMERRLKGLDITIGGLEDKLRNVHDYIPSWMQYSHDGDSVYTDYAISNLREEEERLRKQFTDELQTAQAEYLDLQRKISGIKTAKTRRSISLSVRSSPRDSMPGILETVLNVRRDNLKDAIREVVRSWSSERAVTFRRENNIPDDSFPAIIVQEMVYGDKNDNSGSGVVFARNPNTGEGGIFGNFKVRAQGKEIVSGASTGEPIENLKDKFPEVFNALTEAMAKLEKELKYPQEVEFTIEDGVLYFLQTRDIKFHPHAEARYLSDAVDKGVLTRMGVLPRLERLQDRYRARKICRINNIRGLIKTVLFYGCTSTPGAMKGRVVFNFEDAKKIADAGEGVILILTPSNREDFYKIFELLEVGLVTVGYGNDSSHEAVLSRLAGIPSLINPRGVRVEGGKLIYEGGIVNKSDIIYIDGGWERVAFTYPEDDGRVCLEEDSRLVDILTESIDIGEHRKGFCQPYLTPDGSKVSEDITYEQLLKMNVSAWVLFNILSQEGDEKSIFMANLEKHFLHELLIRKAEQEGKSKEEADTKLSKLITQKTVSQKTVRVLTDKYCVYEIGRTPRGSIYIQDGSVYEFYEDRHDGAPDQTVYLGRIKEFIYDDSTEKVTEKKDGLIARGNPEDLFKELEKQKDTITNLREGIDVKVVAESLRHILGQKRDKIGDEKIVREIEQAIGDLETFDIREFSAIVLDGDGVGKEKQWLLGFNSLAPPMAGYLRGLFPNPTLGYAREVVDNLSGDAFLEYLLHEALCRYAGHYEARRLQEILFGDTNYRDAKGEEGRKEGVVNKALKKIIEDISLGSLNNQWVTITELNNRILLNKETGRIRFGEDGPVKETGFTFWVVRHGETKGNTIEGMFQGVVDEDVNQLTEEGERQAQVAAGDLFSQLGDKIRRGEGIVVITSELGRSRKTAEAFISLVREKTGLIIEPIEEESANEISFGIWDNKTSEQLTPEQRILADRYRNGLDATVKPENGESFLDLVIRTKSFLDKLNKQYKGKTVVLFGHGAQISAIRVLLGDKALVDDTGQIDWRSNMTPNAKPVLLSKKNMVEDEHGQGKGEVCAGVPMPKHGSGLAHVQNYDWNPFSVLKRDFTRELLAFCILTLRALHPAIYKNISSELRFKRRGLKRLDGENYVLALERLRKGLVNMDQYLIEPGRWGDIVYRELEELFTIAMQISLTRKDYQRHSLEELNSLDVQLTKELSTLKEDDARRKGIWGKRHVIRDVVKDKIVMKGFQQGMSIDLSGIPLEQIYTILYEGEGFEHKYKPLPSGEEMVLVHKGSPGLVGLFMGIRQAKRILKEKLKPRFAADKEVEEFSLWTHVFRGDLLNYTISFLSNPLFKGTEDLLATLRNLQMETTDNLWGKSDKDASWLRLIAHYQDVGILKAVIIRLLDRLNKSGAQRLGMSYGEFILDYNQPELGFKERQDISQGIIEKLDLSRGYDLDIALYNQALFSLEWSLANFMKTGAIIANPSKGDTPDEPDYFYNWLRDSWLYIRLLVILFEKTGNDELYKLIGKHILFMENSVARQKPNIQRVDVFGFSPKENWGDQNDGPGHAASALIEFVNILKKKEGYYRDIRVDFYPIIKRNLDFICSPEGKGVSKDIWEETTGWSVYARIIQYSALFKGVDLAGRLGFMDDEARWKRRLAELKREISGHWSKGKGYFVSHRHSGHELIPDGKFYTRKPDNLDSAFIGGLVQLYMQRNIFDFDNERVIKTFLALDKKFKDAYPVNQGREEGVVFWGRYRDDMYDGVNWESGMTQGGNPWWINSLWRVQFILRYIGYVIDKGIIRLDTQSHIEFLQGLGVELDGLRFLGSVKKSDYLFKEIIDRLMVAADKNLEALLRYIPDDHRLSEQIDKENGSPKGAKSLTWSYQEFISTVVIRNEINGLYQKTFPADKFCEIGIEDARLTNEVQVIGERGTTEEAMDILKGIDSTLAKLLLKQLNRRITEVGGIENLDTRERFILFTILSRGEKDLISNLVGVSDLVRGKLLEMLREGGRLTFSQVAGWLTYSWIEEGRFDFRELKPPIFLEGAPEVIFVFTQSPDFLYGERFGSRWNINPPVGMVRTASWLEYLGIKVHIVDLYLGEREWDRFKVLVTDRTKIINFTFNIVPTKFDIEAIYKAVQIIEDKKSRKMLSERPCLVAGGGRAAFLYKELLTLTPIELVLAGSGSLLLTDFIFETRCRRDLLKEIPSSYVKEVSEDGIVHIAETRRVETPEEFQRVVGLIYDSKKLDYEGYWTTLPKDLHPENFMYDMRLGRVLTSFGKCPYDCEFCAYASASEALGAGSYKHLPERDVIQIIGRLQEDYPSCNLIGFVDDDFVLGPRGVRRLKELSALLMNSPYRFRAKFYFETTPKHLELEYVDDLKSAGFSIIIFGVESPVSRVYSTMSKFTGLNVEEMMKKIIAMKNKGIFVRGVGMLFYYSLCERELLEATHNYTELIQNGINLVLYPYVQARPGSRLYNEMLEGKHDCKLSKYIIPDGTERSFPIYGDILPDDLMVRKIAENSLARAKENLQKILQDFKWEGDYPESLGALALFQSTLEEWIKIENRGVSEVALKEELDYVNRVIQEILTLAKAEQTVAGYFEEFYKKPNSETIGHMMGFKEALYIILLRKLDFGSEDEILAALAIIKNIAERSLKSISELFTKDERNNLHNSVLFLNKHPNAEIRDSVRELNRIMEEGYYLSGLRNSKIRAYVTDLMAFCFGQFGIGREEAEKMVEIIAGSNSFDQAKQALYEADFRWGEAGNRYNEIYKRYKRGVAPVTKYNSLREYIKRGGFGKNAVVIDIGCGNHDIARRMINEMRREGVGEDLIPTVIGVDFREGKDVDVSDEYGKLKYRKVETAGKVPIEGESIADKVFIFSSLHHMPLDVIMSMLSEANRILKPNGELVVFEDVVLEGQSPKYNEQGLAVERIKELSGEERRIAYTIFDWHANCVVSGDAYVPITGSYFTESKWRRIFDKAGFYVDYSEYVGVYKGKFSNLPHSVFVLKKTGPIKGYDDEAYTECVEDMKDVMQITEESESIATITDSIVSGRKQGRAFVVAIDGNSGAVKSSTATRVADILESREQKAVVIRRDWFIRGRTGRYSEIKKEIRDNEVSLRDEEIYLRIGQFEKVLQTLEEFNNGTEPETTIHLDALYDKYGGGELTGCKDIPIDRNTVVVIEGNYLLKERWSGYFDLKVLMLARPSIGIARRKDRDTHTDSQEVAEMFWRMNTPSFINYLRGKMPNAKMGKPDIVIHTDSWEKKYRELYEIDINNAGLTSGCNVVGERGWTDREKKMISEVIDKLVSMYGFGILAVIDAIRVVDGLKDDSRGDIIEEDGRHILLLDISSFGVPEFDRGDSECLLYFVMERGLIRSIMSIIPSGDNVIMGLIINYMVLKSAYNRGLKISKETIEEIGADEQFFETLKVLQAMAEAGEEVTDEKIIAVAIEHMRAMPYYEGLFRQFSFASEWEAKIKDAENRYQSALRVFNEIADAKQMAGEVIDLGGLAIKVIKTFSGIRIQGLERIKKKLAGMIAVSVRIASKMDEIASLPLAMTNGRYCIVIDRHRISEGMEKAWGEAIGRLEEKGVFKVLYSVDEALKTYQPQNVIHLMDPGDIKEDMQEGILYLPMPYLRSSLYMAANVVSSEGDISKIDPLVRGLIIDLYSKILPEGRVTEEDLYNLFNAPWNILPRIKSAMDELNRLVSGLVEIEKAA